MKTLLRHCLILSTTTLLLFGFSKSRGAEIQVFAAASLSDALNEIATSFFNQTGARVEFNFAGSGILARQIAEGAPADLFFSADESKMDGLEKKGLLVAGSRKSIVSNTLVVILPSESNAKIRTAKDLASLRTIAMGEPATVPAGSYAREYLTSLGLWESLQKQVLPLDNVRATLAVVEGGNADAGFVYKTDALASKKVKIALEIEAEQGPKISYPVAILAGTKNQKESVTFEDYLGSPAALDTFRKFGFLVKASPTKR